MKFKVKLNEATLDDLTQQELQDREAKQADIDTLKQEKKDAIEAERAAYAEARKKAGNLTAKERRMLRKSKLKDGGEITPEEQALLDKYKEPEDEVAYYDGDIEEALDGAYETAMEQQENMEDGVQVEFPVVWLVGDAGTGKTSRVRHWCDENGIRMIVKSLSSMDEGDLGGAIVADLEGGKARRVSTDEFDEVDEEECVLFLDEYLRGRGTVRQELLTLINDHKIPDKSSPSGLRFFPNLLFVVGATNPATAEYNIEDDFDQAERSRGEMIKVKSDKRSFLWFYRKRQRSVIRAAIKRHDMKRAAKAEGRLQIAEALINNPDFDFDTSDEAATAMAQDQQVLNSRSLSKLLERSNGTVSNFLDLWDRYCNPEKKDMVEDMLSGVADIEDYTEDDLGLDDAFSKDDKANSVFGKSGKSAFDILNSKGAF